MKLKILGLLLASAVAASGANAAVISYTTDFGSSLTDFTVSGLTLSGFNSSLGTLTGVTIDYSYGIDVSGGVTNTSNSEQVFDVTESSKATFTFTGAYAGTKSLTAAADQGYDLLGGASDVFGPYTTGDTGVAGSITSGLTLANFINTALTFKVGTLTGQTIMGGGGNITAGLTTFGSGFAKVTYTYDAAPPSVPEAATWAMMLVGFGAMGATMRRRRTAVTFG